MKHPPEIPNGYNVYLALRPQDGRPPMSVDEWLNWIEEMEPTLGTFELPEGGNWMDLPLKDREPESPSLS